MAAALLTGSILAPPAGMEPELKYPISEFLFPNCKITFAPHFQMRSSRPGLLRHFSSIKCTNALQNEKEGWQSLVYCTGLENRRTARYRGFESLPLRPTNCHSNSLAVFFLGEKNEAAKSTAKEFRKRHF